MQFLIATLTAPSNRLIRYLLLMFLVLAAFVSCRKAPQPAESSQTSAQGKSAAPPSVIAVTPVKANAPAPVSPQAAAPVAARKNYSVQVERPVLAPKTPYAAGAATPPPPPPPAPTAPPAIAAPAPVAVPTLPRLTEGNLAWQPQVRMQKYDVTPYVVALSSDRSIDPLTAIPNSGSQPYQTTPTEIAGVVQADLEPGPEDGVDVNVLPKESSLDRTFSPGDSVVTWTWLVSFKPTMTRSDIALYLTISSLGPDGKPVPLGAPQQVKVHLVSSPKLAAELVEQDLLPTIWNSVNNWVGATVTLLLGALGAWIARKVKQKPASKPASAATKD